MMMLTIKVKYKDEFYSYPKDITMLEISKNFKDNYKFNIIIGSINNKLVELNAKVNRDCEVDFFDVSSVAGNKAYERGLLYLYIKAVKDILNCDVMIEHSIDRGVYTEILNEKREITEQDVINIDKRMHQLVEEKIPFEKLSVARTDAIDYYEINNQIDKAKVLKYISNTFVNMYKFANVYNYFFGDMPIDASYLDDFKLTYVEPNGVIVRYPNMFLGSQIVDYIERKKLFEEFRRYHQWCDTIKINNIASLNEVIISGHVDNIIYLSEVEQNSRLFDIVNDIKNKESVKIILVAGPSSAGKTTTSKKLALYLKSIGINTHFISLDDYFFDKDKTPKNEDGEYDFESLRAINVVLFNQQLQQLLNHEEVLLPKYNFYTGKSEFKNKRLKIDKKDIIIIEGLHALNEDLTASINKEYKYKIYLSPLTSVNIDNHNRITTTDNRLLRRMIRDARFRGYNASMTLASWPKVREGEEKYIFPYQDAADVIFNTSLIYELGVIRLYAESLLFSVSEKDPNYGEAIRLINLLRNILPIRSTHIPFDSILREFIGNGLFTNKE